MSDAVSQQGFILTRHCRSSTEGVFVELWVLTDNGPVKLRSPQQYPGLFVPRSQIEQAQSVLYSSNLPTRIKAVALSTFDHQPVTRLTFDSMETFFQARQRLQQAGILLLEADIRLADAYLMERFVYGSLRFHGEPVQCDGYTEYLNATIAPAEVMPSFTVVSLDIECSAKGELYSVGLVSAMAYKVIMIGEPQSKVKGIEWVDDEAQLLSAMVQTLRDWDPDVIVGWNVVNFDFRLLLKRARINHVVLTLGRDGTEPEWRNNVSDGQQGFITIAGRVVVDGIDGLKTATYQFDSFSLESVSQQLLGKGKAVDNVQDRMAEIEHNFRHDKVALARYNRQDCQLVLDIFRKTKLLPFLALRSRLTGLELDRIGGSVAAFTNLYLPKLHRAGYVAPNRPDDGGLASPGGYVMTSRPGLYDHVLVLDYKSLYPSIIRTFKIDPLGLVEGLKQPDDAIVGYKGALFSRHQHFLPDIIVSLWQQRDEAKRNEDAARSQAIKILMNSFYGVLGSGGCRFYDPRLASSITLRGHDIMQTTAQWIEEQGYQVIYGDTDSTFVWLNQSVSDQQAQDIGQQLAAMVNQRWRDKLKADCDLSSDLEMEFESHFRRFLMPTIRGSEQGSKKRYAGLKVNPGQAPELVFKGLESVRSDWTELAREFQHELYRRVFDGEPVADYIRQVVQQTRAGERDHQLTYRKRLRRPLEEYRRNVPPHVRAARMADALNRQQGKPQQYQHKGWVKYVMTPQGPETLEYQAHEPDYEHYVEKQLKPVGDGILAFINERFTDIIDDQLSLF